VLSTVLAALPLTALGHGAAPAAAAAAEPPVAEVTLAGVTPAVLRPGEELVLAGSVRNVSRQPLAAAQVLLRLSVRPLERRADVRAVSADTGFRSGSRDPRSYQELGDLAGGGSRPFQLRVAAEDLGFPVAGVYVVGVDVRATLQDGRRSTVDTARTVLPWVPEEPARPVDVAPVLPLATQPSLLPDGTLIGDDLAAEVAASGRLGGRLAAGGTDVTWLVDPDLVTTLQVMASGYQVREPAAGSSAASDDTTEGSGAQPAAQFLAELAGTLAAAPGPRRLPSADVDVAALAETGDGQWARATLADALAEPDGPSDVLGTTLDVAVASPTSGLGAAGAALVRSAGDPDVVVGDAGLRAALSPNDDGVDALVALRQRLLAETYLAAANGSAALTMLAPTRWSGGAAETTSALAALRSAPWVRLVTWASLPDPRPARVAASAGNPLPQGHVAAVRSMQGEIDEVSDVLVDPDPVVADFDAAALRALSVAWRSDPDGGASYLRTARGQLRAGSAGVHVLVPEAVTLSARSGRFPLTVVNDLAAAVVVRLELEPANRDRLTITDPGPLDIAAGEKATVTVTAEAAANGRVPVAVRLLTPQGAPVGPTQTMIVVATQYGTVGWIVVAAASTLLLVTVGRRIAARVRAHRAERAAPPSAQVTLGPVTGSDARPDEVLR
jgi:hypothetical protein